MKFEVGKIYVQFDHSGIAWDHCCIAHYYLIERKSDKSIWTRQAWKPVEMWGKDIMSKEEAINIDPATLEFTDIQRSKLGISESSGTEYFYYKDKSIKRYVNVCYCNEVGGNK